MKMGDLDKSWSPHLLRKLNRRIVARQWQKLLFATYLAVAY